MYYQMSKNAVDEQLTSAKADIGENSSRVVDLVKALLKDADDPDYIVNKVMRNDFMGEMVMISPFDASSLAYSCIEASSKPQETSKIFREKYLKPIVMNDGRQAGGAMTMGVHSVLVVMKHYEQEGLELFSDYMDAFLEKDRAIGDDRYYSAMFPYFVAANARDDKVAATIINRVMDRHFTNIFDANINEGYRFILVNYDYCDEGKKIIVDSVMDDHIPRIMNDDPAKARYLVNNLGATVVEDYKRQTQEEDKLKAGVHDRNMRLKVLENGLTDLFVEVDTAIKGLAQFASLVAEKSLTQDDVGHERMNRLKTQRIIGEDGQTLGYACKHFAVSVNHGLKDPEKDMPILMIRDQKTGKVKVLGPQNQNLKPHAEVRQAAQRRWAVG